MSEDVRVRFAPSPTGPLHIGGVRTALYNYLFAKKHGGTFILRIEDTDQKRYVPGAEEYIIESLRWSGFSYDEGGDTGGDYGPYRQSERKDIYAQYAEQLVEKGYAYYAFDTPEELEEMRKKQKAQGVPNPQYNSITRQYMVNSLTLSEDDTKERLDRGDPCVIRIKMPRKEEIKINDLIRNWVVFQSDQLDDKVLVKTDGMPTYHLANVVDDYLMKITHVIRGEEWLSSTPLHVLLYRYLGWEDKMPRFAHLPLLLKPDGNGKLSKRDGDLLGFPVYPLEWKDPKTGEVSSGYRESGYFPEAFVNMLAFLGWHPSDQKEFFTMDELVEAFSLDRVSKAGAKFDFEKAKWFNQQYLLRKDSSELAPILQKDLEKRGTKSDLSHLEKICDLIKERAVFTNQLADLAEYFFKAPESYHEKTLKKKWTENSAEVLNELKSLLNQLSNYSAENVENVFHEILKKYQLGMGALMPLFRVALTGEMGGPPVFQIAETLGKEETIRRIDTFVKYNTVSVK